MKVRTTLVVASLALALAVSAQASVISVSAVASGGPTYSVGETVTVVWYAEDTAGTGIIGMDARILYDPLEVDVVSMTNNVGNPQTAAPYPLGFQFPVPSTSGAVDDGVGTISNVGGSTLTFFGGVPIGATGSPAVVFAAQFQILAGVGPDTTITLAHKLGSPTDTFGLSDGRGGDAGVNVPLGVTLVVPEPTTLLVLGAGVVALLGVRTKKTLM